MSRGMGILLAVLASAGAGPSRDEPTDLDVLGKGLASVRVVSVNGEAKTVCYLPTKVHVSDKGGKAQKGLPRIDVGQGQGLVQGQLSLKGSEDDLEELGKRVKNAFPGYRVEKVKVDAFGLLLRHGDEVVWERPVAGGDTSKIPVQGLYKGAGDLNMEGLIVWVEKLPPLDATVHFDMNKIAKTFEAKFGLDAVIPLGEWSTLSGSLLESGAIKIEMRGTQPEAAKAVAIPLIVTHLERVLTDEKAETVPPPKAPPIKKDEKKDETPSGLNLSVRLGYRLSKVRAVKKDDDTLNLSVSQPVRRTLSFAQAVPVQQP